MPESAVWKTYRVPIVLGGVSVLCTVISVVLLIKSFQPQQGIEFLEADVAQGNSNQSSMSAQISFILVDVEGAVVAPGIIRLPAGSRIDDALTGAGGFRKDADTEYVSKYLNRAMELYDGMKVYIPKAGEILSGEDMSHNIGTLLQRPDGQSQNVPVSINTASQAELESLPGVGPVTAVKIIENRPYARLDELIEKKAIGPSLFEKLEKQLSL